MKPAPFDHPALLSRSPQTGYYVIGMAATTIGILVVVLLNLFTPLESIQERILGTGQWHWHAVIHRFLPRLLLLLLAAYGAVTLCIRVMIRPIGRCLGVMRVNETPDETQMNAARRRLLNLPFVFVMVSVGMWVAVPALIAVSLRLTGVLDHRTAVILAVRASMVGLIASAVAFHEIESWSRKRVIPLFFPEGRLSEVAGAARISIAKRIRLVNRVGNIVPMTILMVTLVTMQWEVDSSLISAEAYGRNIIAFAFIIFGYAVLVTANLNRVVSRSITQPLAEMIRVLQRVRRGNFDETVRVISNDEIGYTGDVINEMTRGLKERETLRRSLELAREVQQSLLPAGNPRVAGLDIAGTSIYCDETGGDYYDFILPDGADAGAVRILVGDVSGHGISSALLMATARALLRQRALQPGTPAAVVSDVNRLLCRDVTASGSFMTLFYLDIDTRRKTLAWVRAGHDPALLYDPGADTFTDIKGEGVALGLDENWQYRQPAPLPLVPGQIVVVYTDGIWEAHNRRGEMFGKRAMRAVLRRNAGRPAQQMIDAVIDALQAFQAGAARADDLTLMVIKVNP